MDLSNTRQRLALAVVVIAGLAALATSGPYYFIREAKGQSTADPHSAWISGVVSVRAEGVGDSAEPYFTIVVRDRGLEGNGANNSEGRVVVGNEPDDSAAWAQLPIEHNVPPSVCEGTSLCEVEFAFQLRPSPPRSGPVVISWTIETRFYRGSEESAGVAVTDPAPAPTAASVAALAAAVGAGAGALIAFMFARGFEKRRRIALVVTAITATLVSIAFVLHGVLVQEMPQAPMLVAAIGVTPLLVALLPRKEGQARGEVLAVGMISIPVLLGVFNDQGTYRLVDIIAVFAAAGVSLSVGAVLLWMTRNRERMADSWPLRGGWSGVAGWSVALIATIAVATLLVAAGTTEYPLGYIVVPVVAYALLAWGLWRWLNGSALVIALTGIVLAVAAVLGWFAARLPFFFSAASEPGWVFLSLAFIGLGGIVLLVLTLSGSKDADRATR